MIAYTTLLDGVCWPDAVRLIPLRAMADRRNLDASGLARQRLFRKTHCLGPNLGTGGWSLFSRTRENAIETALHTMKNNPRSPRRTPHWVRRSTSSPDNRADLEGPVSGSFTPRESPKRTRKLTQPIALETIEEPRLALSRVIDQTINVINEREEQRHKLINTLIVVQLLITAAVSLGYHDKPGLIFPIMLGSLGIYLIALVTGYLLKNDRLAAYLLVFGGGLAVAAQVVAATLAGSPEEIGHVSLFFLAVMLESGLLLTPEVTVIVVTAASALTGAMLLLVAFNNAVSGPQIYQIVLYTLSPMALTAIVSWLLAHFIYATAVTAQRAHDLEFRQAQFQQMKLHERERQEQLDGSIGAIQTAIAQAITGDYTIRVPVTPGDLEVVENSLNLLLDTFDSMVRAQQENARMAGAVMPITEELSRMGGASDAGTPVHPIKTDTPFDNVSVVMSRVADSYNRRISRLQEQIGRLAAGVAHSRNGLANTSEEFTAAEQQVGALISRADAVSAPLRKQLELLAQARHMMVMMLPPEITRTAEQTSGGDPALRGLGIGVEQGHTTEFKALEPASHAEAGIAPLTRRLPAVDASAAAATPSSMSGGLPAELVEVWHLLLQIGEELLQQERTVAAFTQELGVLSRTVRQGSRGIDWTITALDSVQRSSEMAQQSSAQNPKPDRPEDMPSDGQDSGGFSSRPAGPSRPLWSGSSAPESANRPPPPPRSSLNSADLLGDINDALGKGFDAGQEGTSAEG